MEYICDSCNMLCVEWRDYIVVVIGGKRKVMCRECYSKLRERGGM